MKRRTCLIALSLGALAAMSGCAERPLFPGAAPSTLPPLPPGAYIDPATVRWGQNALEVAGFPPDMANGDLTPGTRTALAAFQQAKGLRVTAAFDDVTMQYLSTATGLRAPGDPPMR